MKTTLSLVIATCLLASCSGQGERIAFDGQFYRTSFGKLDERHRFQVSARPVSASLDGAREAARYEAVQYCVINYGSSDIDWVISPDAEAAALPVADDVLTLQGACPQ